MTAMRETNKEGLIVKWVLSRVVPLANLCSTHRFIVLLFALKMSADHSSKIAESIEKKNQSFQPRPPTFASKEEEREFLKFRLAQAFRIFGGWD